MSKVDWSKAPKGAHVYAGDTFWRKIESEWWCYLETSWVPCNIIYKGAADSPYWFLNAEGAGGAVVDSCQVAEQHDPVNKPKHYAIAPDVEAIDIIRSALTPEQFKGYLLGNFLKYRLRAGDKGDLQQDIDKSNWYKRELNK